MSGRQARASKRRKFRTVTQALKDLYCPHARGWVGLVDSFAYLPSAREMSMLGLAAMIQEKIEADIQQFRATRPSGATFYTFGPPHA